MKLCGKCGTWDMRPGERCKQCGDKYGPGQVGHEHADGRFDRVQASPTGRPVPTWRDDRMC